MLKKLRDSVKRVATFAEKQSLREACHYLTLMDNTQIFYSDVFVFLLLVWPNSKMRGDGFIF